MELVKWFLFTLRSVIADRNAGVTSNIHVSTCYYQISSFFRGKDWFFVLNLIFLMILNLLGNIYFLFFRQSILMLPTIIQKIFETNPGFHVK